nr:uncharacterized protein LOC129270101 [Lytechinus pictus]
MKMEMGNKRAMLWFGVLGAMLFFSSPADCLGTVYDIDMNKYVGTWYNMYTNYWSDSFLGTEGAECTTAQYSKLSETSFAVVNTYTVEGELVTTTGNARVPLPSEPGKILVNLDNQATESKYWILKLGPIVNNQYEYSVITDDKGQSLSVLARDPETFDLKYDAEVTEYLLITRFTTPTTQRQRVYHGNDCTY